MTSRKIPNIYENPFDIFLINICEMMNPYFKKLNFTPNGITTLSLIFGILRSVSTRRSFKEFLQE